MKKIKVAINGFGRIGRHACKIALAKKNIEVVAINDLTDNETLAHLFKYDSAYGTYKKEVKAGKDSITIGTNRIKVFAEKNPKNLPWKKLKVDVVLECTGVFRTKKDASLHIKAGAKKVLISAPAKGDGVSSYVKGVNHKNIDSTQTIFDNASCTTNCTAPIMKVLEDNFGIEKALLTTVHAYTADQRLQDAPHKDLRRARAAAQNIIPTSTGAAVATCRAIPTLANKFDGMAMRVPTITVSLVDISIVLSQEVTVKKLNDAFTLASKKQLKGVLDVTNEPLVSSDFIGNAHSATVDLELTKVVGGDLVKIVAWYDNEWGYASRLVDMLQIISV